jgi:putative ABC transport system substrate-binding protein
MPTLAAELVRRGTDIIVAAGPEARIAAMKATSTIPIVTVGGFDPVAEGWATSLARPGGNQMATKTPPTRSSGAEEIGHTLVA